MKMGHLKALQFSLTCVLLISCGLCQCPFYQTVQPENPDVPTTTQPDHPQCPIRPDDCQSREDTDYFRSFDGSCNNLKNSDYGMAFSRYIRLAAPNYADGVESPAVSVSGNPYPNPRTLSLKLFGEDEYPSHRFTLAAMIWGQHVGHDITGMFIPNIRLNCCAADSDTNPACLSFPTDPDDLMRKEANITCLSFPRTSNDEQVCGKTYYKYAEKITTATGFLDCSNVYGTSAKANAAVRTLSGGQFQTSTVDGQTFIPIAPGNTTFVTPDFRQTNIPILATVHTLLLREHNRVASKLAEYNPQWDDEKLFQVARKIVIAQYQKITFYDYFVELIGRKLAEKHRLVYKTKETEYVYDYDENAEAASICEFAIVAIRYIHHMIPGAFALTSPDYLSSDLKRLSDFFNAPGSVSLLTEPDGVSSLLRGLASYPAKKVDRNIDKEMKYFLFRIPGQQFGRDVKAMDIQRGRDFGIASYNSLRKYCGLKVATTWNDFSDYISQEKIEMLKQYYVSPDDVELNVGGSCERHVPGTQFGPTFNCIVTKQLLNLRTGDRFWFESPNPISGFTPAQLKEIRKATLSRLICANSDVSSIQTNAFVFAGPNNERRPCGDFAQLDLSKWKE